VVSDVFFSCSVFFCWPERRGDWETIELNTHNRGDACMRAWAINQSSYTHGMVQCCFTWLVWHYGNHAPRTMSVFLWQGRSRTILLRSMSIYIYRCAHLPCNQEAGPSRIPDQPRPSVRGCRAVTAAITVVESAARPTICCQTSAAADVPCFSMLRIALIYITFYCFYIILSFRLQL
jgi:hypothetical protein